MIRATTILLMGFILGACVENAGFGAATASTTAASTTASIAITTTPAAATTTLATTTTTTPPTTLLAGNWAEQPVIASGIGKVVLGWWDGSSWVEADEGMELPIEGGEDYQIVLDGKRGVIQGSAQVQGCDIVFPSDFPGIEFSDADALSRFRQEGDEERLIQGVAISAGWELRPRPVMDGEAHPDLEATAVDLLEERGFDVARVHILQTIDADLDGDGAIETLVVAEDTELANSNSDVYSILFAVSPSWEQPALIAGSVIPADETGYPESYRISAVSDLSGDGRMEVIVDAQGWETGGVTAHELVASGFEERLGAGCGV